jgi:UDP-N-acetylglucosamine transferase subunit ALG13
MIFVTVGTHEQPFNRLIEEVDRLKGDGIIEDEVIIQRGYSTYEPKNCKCYDLIPWEEMQRYNKEARIVITHGGPASFIDVLSIGKTPIVVPRQSKFNEHVNDHQLEFSKKLLEKGANIIVIENIDDLKIQLEKFDLIANKATFHSNNKLFNKILEEEIIKNW